MTQPHRPATPLTFTIGATMGDDISHSLEQVLLNRLTIKPQYPRNATHL
jgi:hypothetical protein